MWFAGLSDYFGLKKALYFLAGITSQTVAIYTIDNTIHEAMETFNVVLSNPIGAKLGTNATASVIIIDNDSKDDFH